MGTRTQTRGRSRTYRIALAIGITVIMWASAFPGIRIALISFSPGELAFLRFSIASLTLAVFLMTTRLPLPRGRDWVRITFAGGLGIAAYNLALNEGEMHINAGTASFLMSLSPMFTVLLGVLLRGEHLTRWGIVSIALSFIGVELLAVFGQDRIVFNHGTALVLFAATCQAIQFVIQKPLLERYSVLAVTSCVIWAGTLFLLPFSFSSVTALEKATPTSVIALLFLALGPAATAYISWSYVLAHYSMSRAAPFMYLIPLVSLLISLVTLGEEPTATMLLGGILTLAGVIGMNTFGKRVNQ